LKTRTVAKVTTRKIQITKKKKRTKSFGGEGGKGGNSAKQPTHAQRDQTVRVTKKRGLILGEKKKRKNKLGGKKEAKKKKHHKSSNIEEKIKKKILAKGALCL